MSFATEKLNREKVTEAAKECGKTELHLIADLDISQATYYRRMKLGWTKEQVFALCFLLGVDEPSEFYVDLEVDEDADTGT